MRSFRPADTRSLVNLLRNGGLDYIEQKDGYLLPHFWDLTNLVPRSEAAESKSSYEIITGETPPVGGLVDYWKLLLLDGRESQLSQSLLSAAVFDFPTPLAPNSVRQEVAGGYLSRHERLIYRTRPLSLGLSLRVVRGSVDVTVRVADETGSLAADAVLVSRADASFTGRRWRRLAVSFTPTASPAVVSIVLRRATGSDLAEVHVGNVQMVLGAYADVPYTGDPSVSAIPSGAVIMTMGDACPPGFTELTDENGAQVPEAWTAADPAAEVRRGNFPYHSADQSATDGEPTHNADEPHFTLVNDDVIALESFSSKLASSTNTYNATVRCPADEPNEDGAADHQHGLTAGGSVPVNRPLRFCRRL